MPKQITLCMIVRDEEPCLKETIDSCRADFDQLVIVDTGSKDGTVSLARALGAEVHDFKWIDDFSAARNFAQSKCQTDWVFMIDADELLAQDSRGAVRQAIETAPDEVSAIHPMLCCGEDGKDLVHVCDKVYRQSKCHWKNPSHNVLMVDKGVRLVMPNIRILHRRARRGSERNATRNRQRNEMNEANFRRLVAENPQDTRSTWYLALTLQEAGKTDEALQWWDRYLEIGTWGEELYEAHRQIAECYISKGDANAAVEHLVLAHQHEPRRAEAAMRLGDMYSGGRAYRRARFWYQVAAMMEPPPNSGCMLYAIPRCYGPYPYLRLARLTWQTGERGNMEEYLSQAHCACYGDKDALDEVALVRRELTARLNSEEYWDAKYAAARDVGDAHRELLKHLAAVIAEIAPGGKVLDVGAGTGELLDALVGQGLDAVGVDFSAEAASKHERVLHDDAVELRTQDDSIYDVVTCVSLLEHVEEPQAILSQMIRVAKPSGVLVVSVPREGAMDCVEHIREYGVDALREEVGTLTSSEVKIEAFGAWLVAVSRLGGQYDEAYFSAEGSAHWPHGHRWETMHIPYRERVKELKAAYPLANSALDVGCGRGLMVRALKAAGLRAEGCDVSRYAVADQPDEEAAASLTLTDVTEGLPYEDEAFDVVTAYDLLEHIEESKLDRVVSEMRRVCKHGLFAYVDTQDRMDTTHTTIKPKEWWVAQHFPEYFALRDLPVQNTKKFAVACAKRPLLDLYCGRGHERWGPWSLQETGLRGSWKAVVYVAQALVQRGWLVRIYADPGERAGEYDGVQYLPYDQFDPTQQRVACVAARQPWLLERPLYAQAKIYSHQDLDEGAGRYAGYPHVFVSDWQMQLYKQRYGSLGDGSVVIPNGVDTALFRPGSEREHFLLFAAQPQRGLDVMLQMWPRIRERLGSNWELRVCGSFDTWRQERPQDPAAKRIEELAHSVDGVRLLGMVPEAEVASLMGQAMLLVYPSTFPETCCTVAVEAQSAGLPIVGRALGALPETCSGEVGVLIEGDPHSQDWQDSFVEQCVALVGDEERWQRYSTEGQKEAKQRFDWPLLVDQWHDLLERTVKG